VLNLKYQYGNLVISTKLKIGHRNEL